MQQGSCGAGSHEFNSGGGSGSIHSSSSGSDSNSSVVAMLSWSLHVHVTAMHVDVTPPPQGVFHRDLQLSAVRLDACGGVVLTDFGYSAAKLCGSGEHADARDRSSTPAFTPPEVLLGHSIVNASYDGESLGERLKARTSPRSSRLRGLMRAEPECTSKVP